ncbi:MAG: hypothetical protein R6W06_12130 [Prochlorococcaceae cyanobacterium]
MARRPAAWPALGALPALALVAGCSGTPFGDRLARSFSGGAAAPDAAPAAGPEAPPAQPATQPPAPAAPGKPAPAKPPAPAAAPAAVASPPAPYRVTLKLPLADPSAPAEAVTRALRAAGVPFEVETIERVAGPSSAPLVPSQTPAPPITPPPITPAPAPR